MTMRTALLGTILALAAAPAAAQTRFEVAAGTQFMGSRPPVTRGWIASAAFEIDGQTYVVEGAWFRRTTVRRFDPWDPDAGRETFRGANLSLAAGVRSPKSEAPVAPFYQVLLGGFHTRFRTDYEWPAYIDTDAENADCGGYWDGVKTMPCLNVPYPEYRETRRNWLLFQPGLGLDVRIRRGVGFRALMDVLGLVNRDWGVEWAPRMSARVVVEFGR